MKKKLNWIDLVIIGVLFGIVYLGYYLIKAEDNSTDEVAIEVVYRMRGLLVESANAIQVGDVFLDTITNKIIGEVIDKEVKDSYELVETGDGRIVKSKNPNRFDVYMTMTGRGLVTDDFIRLADREMRVEEIINLKSRICSLTSTIMDIKILE